MNEFISLSSQNSTPYICILVSYVKVWSPREKITSVNTFLVPITHTLNLFSAMWNIQYYRIKY